MKFTEVSTVFEQIEKIRSRLEITQLLATLFKKATTQEIGIICNISLGKLHPPYIGTQFNIAEKNIIKVLIELLHLSQDQVKKEGKVLGDFGALVFQYKWNNEKQLTVSHVYDMLCDLEQMSGIGSQEEKITYLHHLLLSLDSVSAKYVLRIILGKLRLGFSDMTLIDALSWMEVGNKSLRFIIEDAYNVCADIGLIASTLKNDGIRALEDMHVKVGIPIRPAAAERLQTAKAIVEKIGVCVAQPKLDGFRLQIHVNKTMGKAKIKIFSRNLQDMSFMFPDITDVFLQLPVDSLICEGEAIVFNPYTDVFLPFQETVKRKRKHGIEQAMTDLPLRVFIFDLLYLNGQDLLSQTHAQRREILRNLLEKTNSPLINIIEEKIITNSQELEQYFIATVEVGLEGLVVKRPDTIYKPGKRNFNWIKLKRQEEGHLEDTIDCIILGYYAGKGKRAKFGIGAFLVGIYNKQDDMFQTVAKIGTGLKDDEWKDLKQKCDAIALQKQSSQVQCAKELAPDVWVSPEIVCIVRADEITLSPLHSAGKTEKNLGFALRFPRILGYRSDKGPQEVTQDVEIKQLYKDQF